MNRVPLVGFPDRLPTDGSWRLFRSNGRRCGNPCASLPLRAEGDCDSRQRRVPPSCTRWWWVGGGYRAVTAPMTAELPDVVEGRAVLRGSNTTFGPAPGGTQRGRIRTHDPLRGARTLRPQSYGSSMSGAAGQLCLCLCLCLRIRLCLCLRVCLCLRRGQRTLSKHFVTLGGPK